MRRGVAGRLALVGPRDRQRRGVAAAGDAADGAEAEAERRRTLASGLTSHACATALLVGVGHLTAALAPPARIGVLADRTSWAFGKPSKYLEDVGMFVNNFARRKGP